MGSHQLLRGGGRERIFFGRAAATMTSRRAKGETKAPSISTLERKRKSRKKPTTSQAKKERDSWRLTTGAWPASIYLSTKARPWEQNPTPKRSLPAQAALSWEERR